MHPFLALLLSRARDQGRALREGWTAYREYLDYCRFCDRQAEEHHEREEAAGR